MFSKSKNNKAVEISKQLALKNGKEFSKSVFERAADSGEKLKVKIVFILKNNINFTIY